ncbi:hypothetical protein [Sphingomicrobium sediminis]|uniref:Uncharacterized protein n=1 Tax=Sphingomicrobium sediminis TaxID=2950949 RepID=A0A9X2J3R5_9SPHN|nr:hypothetical protein [Sphingomicrobium sediminis]MCM8558340.1 hypothetical protein [Sphingomicrobium sediminis]
MMKLAIFASILMVGATAAPAAAQEYEGPGATGTVDVCKLFAEEVGLLKVRGLCNAFYLAEDPVGQCIVLRDMGVLADLGIRTQGECIDWLKGDED